MEKPALRFIWDYDNITHIARHSLYPEDVEYALNGRTEILESQDWYGEDRISEIGMTASGRVILVHSTVREDGVRVVTAYDPPKRLIREYLHRR